MSNEAWPDKAMFEALKGQILGPLDSRVAGFPENAVLYNDVTSIELSLQNRSVEIVGFALRGDWAASDFSALDTRTPDNTTYGYVDLTGAMARPSRFVGFTDIVFPVGQRAHIVSGHMGISLSQPKAVRGGDAPASRPGITGSLIGPAEGAGKLPELILLEAGAPVLPVVPVPSTSHYQGGMYHSELVVPLDGGPRYIHVFYASTGGQGVYDEHHVPLTPGLPQ